MKNSDFTFMRSGAESVLSRDKVDIDFLRMVSAILKILLKEAINSAEYFTKACGRKYITSEDTKIALKYEAHEFFSKSWDGEFLQNMEEEKRHTYETESESEESDDDESRDDSNESRDDRESNEDDESKEVYTTQFAFTPGIDKVMYDTMIHYRDTWEAWHPEDKLQGMLKRAIDATP